MSRSEPAEIAIGTDAERFPRALRHIHDPPRRLHLRGALARDPTALDAPAIAVVGARDATAYGLAMARALGRTLAESGLVVVSGLALGIDGAAHRGALEAGGRTVAVVGGGTDVVYPRQNAGLRSQILRHGLLVSEHPAGTAPRPGQFPRRNRIVSGLSLGVVVVEATLRSGSLSTAAHALEQGREVFAVPGPAGAPRSAGPHALLRRGAKLVESVDDVLAELPAGIASPPDDGCHREARLPPDLERVRAALRAGLATADELALHLGVKIPEILENLVALELRGVVVRGPGGRYFAVAHSR
jgi:DNA processing protein